MAAFNNNNQQEMNNEVNANAAAVGIGANIQANGNKMKNNFFAGGQAYNNKDRVELVKLGMCPNCGEVQLRRPASFMKKEKIYHEICPLCHGTTTMNAVAERVAVRAEAANMDNNKPNAEGWTPLSLAAKNGNLETVKTLIAAGADVNKAETTYGSTPLFMAARNGHLEVVRALVGARANLNKARKDGLTPLSIANKHGRSSIVSYLQRKEAR